MLGDPCVLLRVAQMPYALRSVPRVWPNTQLSAGCAADAGAREPGRLLQRRAAAGDQVPRRASALRLMDAVWVCKARPPRCRCRQLACQRSAAYMMPEHDASVHTIAEVAQHWSGYWQAVIDQLVGSAWIGTTQDPQNCVARRAFPYT